MKPIEFAALLAMGGVVLWVSWRPAPTPTPLQLPPAVSADAPLQLPPTESGDARQERQVHLLCDREVDALLHEKDLIEIVRAWAIVHAVPCGIERRL